MSKLIKLCTIASKTVPDFIKMSCYTHYYRKVFATQKSNYNFYHTYGRNEFSDYEGGDSGYSFFSGLIEATVADTKIYIPSFKIYTVISVIQGLTVELAANGCHKMLPRLFMSRKVAFDGITQLYAVQVVLNKKFHLVGMFLLQSATEEVFTAIFKEVKVCLGSTTVSTFMTDYESAPRSLIGKVWPIAKKRVCAVYYIEYCLKRNIFRDPILKEARECALKAFGMCFLKNKYIKPAIEHINRHSSSDGPSAKFCTGLDALKNQRQSVPADMPM
ncbi:hypothetical protein HA402_007317 [Bradysia odoriphaga]|nr:hypothetical protein HA402_007317 [Bradysia odoriphaga]